MGQFEKIVVLLSFFLVTVILVISFSSDEQKPFPMGPADEVAAAGPEHLAGHGSEPATPPAVAEDVAAPEATFVAEPALTGVERNLSPPVDPRQHSLQALRDREAAAAEEVEIPDLLLDTATTNRSNPATPRAKLPGGSALITLEGLEETFESEIKEYTWQRGDTFVSVAKKLYGDSEKARLLRQFNEDVSYKAPGERILVPVYDRRSTARTGSSTTTPPPVAGSPYVVVEGDSLWVISKKVYGKGALWEKIFEANRDLLDSPDDVAVGQELAIP